MKYNPFRKRRKIFITEDVQKRINVKLGIGVIGTLIILLVLPRGKLVALGLLYLLLNMDYVIDFIEGVQVRRFSSFKDLVTRVVVRHQVSKVLIRNIVRQARYYQLLGNIDVIRVPFVNCYVSNGNGQFSGQIEVEQLPELENIFNGPDMIATLNSAFRNMTKNLRITDTQVSKTGNSVTLDLENVNIDSQLKITNGNDIPIYDKYHVELDKGHYFDWDKQYHCLVSGKTGSGKTTLMKYLIAIVSGTGEWNIAVVDPKKSELSRIEGTPEVTVAYEQDEMIGLLRKVVADLNIIESYHREHPIESLVPHLIVVDELAAWKEMVSKTESGEIDGCLKQIALLGRELNFHLLVGIQQANARNISTEIREQFSERILLGNSELRDRKFLFPDIQDGDLKLDPAKFEGLAGKDDGTPERIIAPFIGMDLIKYINR